MEVMSAEIPSEAPSEAEDAREWDRMSVREFMNRECWTTYTCQKMEQLVRDSFAVDPCEMSTLFFLWAIKNGNEWSMENHRFIGGAQQICGKIADALGSRIQFCPPLPPIKSYFAQRFTMGSVIKCISWYERPFWREKGLSGIVVTDSCPVYSTMAELGGIDCHSAIIGFVLGNEARYWSNRTMAERRKAISAQYAVLFDSQDALYPSQYTDISWDDEAFTRGGYAAVLPCGVLSHHGNADSWWKPCGNLYFAGTETALEWSGYMEGAVQAGESAANQVLQSMGKIPSPNDHTNSAEGARELRSQRSTAETGCITGGTVVTCLSAAVLVFVATCIFVYASDETITATPA